MKHLKTIFACLLMTVLSIGQVWGLTNTYTKITSATSLDESAEYVIGDVDNYGCPTNTGGTAINTTEASWVHWNAKNVDGGFYLYNGAVYLKVPASNAWGSGTSSDCSVLTANSEGILAGNDGTNDRILVKNSSNAYLRWYKSGQTKAYLYKIEASSSTACATPIFSPEAGSYEGAQNVTITSTDGATIYYTTDGSTPTTSSSVYSSSISVSADMTIKAYAVKSGLDDSEVATAAYTITEGPDVTLDFTSNTEWAFPTSKQIPEGTYSDGTYTVKVAGSTGNGFNFNSGKLLLGKLGAYLILPEFEHPIARIECPGVSGASGSVTWNVFDGDNAVSTEVTGCTADKSFEIEPLEANKEYTIKVTNGNNLQISKIKIFFGAAPAVAKPTISGDVNFVGSTTVTITHADADHIYYTTNGVDPTTSSTEYLAPFTVDADGTTTVKAIAVKGSDVSDPATKTFTKVEALESLAALLEATVSAETAFNVVISNWVVTGVNGSRAWIADAANTKGILLYKSGHGFVVGNKLNGVVMGTKTKLYQGYPELTTLVSTDVTVTTAETVTPRTTTIAALTSGHPAEQGTVVKLENVTYSSSVLSDGVNSIAADNKLFSSLALVDGTTYDITGVVEYLDGSVVKIMPRSADDVEAKSAVVTPTAANLAALKAAERGTYILTLTNAVVTYVNGNNAFIEDATGGALIYFASHGYSAGDCLNGDYQVTTTDYQGKFEITAMEPQAGAATTTAEIPLTTVSITTLNANFASYESRRIKIAGANVTDAISGSDRNGAINDGAALAVYAAVASTITLTADDNVDIIGYPGFHNTDQQLNVWRQEDITVNVKADPEISYSPATLTIEEGDEWSAPTLVNPHSLTISSYASNNESVATVTGEGVIALAGGIGTAVITAHTNGDATYAAGNATYTITVNEAGSYSMSFDFTRASYDDAADEAVVWNSSVATITATKGTGTKVTNYLAGNYSGTTLIAETRLYANNSLGFEAKTGASITKVEVTMTAASYASALAGYDWTNASAEVSSTNSKVVVITPTAATFSAALTGQIRITQVAVYYTAESEKSKLTASIAIDDMNMAVGDDDILLSAIAATSNPNKKAISYAVTSGSEYVSITGEGAEAALHAIAEGTATVTATIPDNLGNYTGATTTFDIVVAAAPATLVSIAISGAATELEYTDGQHFDPTGLVVTGTYSDASSAPITEGIDWTFAPDPLTEGTTSVSVTATVGEISSDAVVVNGLTVAAAPAPTSGNVVILAEYDSKFYAMSNTLNSNALKGVVVEKDGSNIVVSSAEDKAAIQWTATVDGDNTTLKDADDYYITGSSTASLSLDANPFNWTWNGEKSCYVNSETTSRGLFFSNSGNVFKGYALSNITSDGYAAIEVIEIEPENIVISSKVDPELAYTPASDEITVGDAWSAPVLGYVEGFDGLAAISYESSNEAVVTVSDAGVIALAGGTGTATITATFGGNTNYLAGSATYTVKVNPVIIPKDCDGEDDFNTVSDASGYGSRTSTAGWSAVNTAVSTVNEVTYWVMQGNTSSVGVITSPELHNGIGKLTLDYMHPFSEANGVSFKVEIKQNGALVEGKSYTITNATAEQNTVYSETIENINVEGDFQIVITNLSPSAKSSSKDRFGVGNLCWKNYSAPEPPTPATPDYTRDVTNGHYGTICLPKAGTIEGATLYEIGSFESNMIYVDEVGTTLAAGVPYIFYASEAQLNVYYTDKTADDVSADNANGLYGFYNLSDEAATYDIPEGAGNYILYNDQYWEVSGRAAYIANYRAYIKIGSIVPKAAAPGRRRVAMAVNGTQTATGIEDLNASEKPMKMMINGQIFILRGEKMYDTTGRLVK